MRIGLRQFSLDTIAWLKMAVEAGDCTRSSLARELCDRENWHNALGHACLASARAALPKLAASLELTLPEPRAMGGVTAESQAVPQDYPDRTLNCAPEALGPVSVVPVEEGGDRRGARSMMATHHPEGDACCPGGRLRYWIVCERHGVLGGAGVRRRVVAPEGAGPAHRLVAGCAGRQHRPCGQQRPYAGPARGPGSRTGVAVAVAGLRTACR